MEERYLEISFQGGHFLAAYLYLPRPDGACVLRTEEVAPGLLLDRGAGDAPLGLEILSPALVSLRQVNAVLGSLALPPVHASELEPLGLAA